jgi:pyruvate/2-oxoglutarate dehydrogenase complex dihydrolipoamide dehydrogenase (E3) component
MGDIISWYEKQLNQLGIEIRLNTTVDGHLLDQIKPDVIVLAAGSLPEVPLGYIVGLENVKDIELLTVDELLEEEKLTGENVLVTGADQIGLQVADYLAEQGKQVYVVGYAEHFAASMASNDSYYLIGRLISEGAKRNRRVTNVEILPTDEVWIVTDKGREKLPQIDTIVFADKRRPNRSLIEVAEGKGIQTHVIGDASGTTEEGQGTVYTAIAAGYDIGRII